jgi:hypothetical protein
VREKLLVGRPEPEAQRQAAAVSSHPGTNARALARHHMHHSWQWHINRSITIHKLTLRWFGLSATSQHYFFISEQTSHQQLGSKPVILFSQNKSA